MAGQKVEICLKKKNPPRAQIFRYFCIESRNNKYNCELCLLTIRKLFREYQLTLIPN